MTNEPITITEFLAWRIVAAPNWMCLVTSFFLADYSSANVGGSSRHTNDRNPELHVRTAKSHVRFGLIAATSENSLCAGLFTTLLKKFGLLLCTQLVERLEHQTDLFSVFGFRVHLLKPIHQRGIFGT
jgi:hypothetical protein